MIGRRCGSRNPHSPALAILSECTTFTLSVTFFHEYLFRYTFGECNFQYEMNGDAVRLR